MKFDEPAGTNPIDQLKVVGRPADRIDGPLKTTGTAPYAHDRHDVVQNQAYGYVVGAAIAKGRIASMNLEAARAAPGVLAIVTADSAGRLDQGERNTARLLGGPEIQHYHQAVALVVAETFEQARDAAHRLKIRYAPAKGRFDLEAARDTATIPEKTGSGDPAETAVGDFEGAFRDSPVQLDQTYRTAYESHSMMEPHASVAAWDADGQLTLWTSNQMIAWTAQDMAKTLRIPRDKVRVMSPYIGGGFGGKLFLRADVLLAALGARAAKRPVKVSLTRALMPNNTTHRPATIQRIRIGAQRDGHITAIAHESWSADLPGGGPETAVLQTRALYAGAHRMTALRLAEHDLPEGNAMRAPGEAPGLAALEIAIDEISEKLGIDPVAFRILNDTQVVPDNPAPPDPDKNSDQTAPEARLDAGRPRRFSQRQLVRCLETGAERFGWKRRRSKPGSVRAGHWLVGMGVAAAFRNNLLTKSAARVRLDRRGRVTVETDMTDIGTGSYTILAQTAAEMMGVPLSQVDVRLGDSSFPASCGSGGQWGGNNSTAGVYAACTQLRRLVAARLGFDADASDLAFSDGEVRTASRSAPLMLATRDGPLEAEDAIEYGDLDERFQQSTFGAHFAEVRVDAYTGEVRVQRQLAVCAAGRILNPKTARSQIIGAMTMGVGAALMESLHVDTGVGFFVNHDLAGYEIPVHADIPHQDAIFLDEVDPMSSPMKAKGVAELGICGAAAAVANAVYNATGVRVRHYPLTLDKLVQNGLAIA
ncbi:MAG: xanthine dehydrogenase, molybdenum binding subunit apoprotein [Panacagrimonas sp.]|nr:aldehyde oxidoreductase molybdenum-binding subunit PaoC [Panacagrimonas sp.]MCC2656738.1 xanthine dehydrogenase, molybdenum binding subunit apoprotein [Panacagrimonas sp.]